MLGKKKELEIPVYLFMGFLEAGKTTFIQETLEEDYFNDGERTLLFACEEGMEEYDEELLKRTNTTVVYVEEQEDFNTEFLTSKLLQYYPDRVIIEYNGMWTIDHLVEAMEGTPLMIFQTIVSANAETFDLYMNNMRSLAVEMFRWQNLLSLTVVQRQHQEQLTEEVSKLLTVVYRSFLILWFQVRTWRKKRMNFHLISAEMKFISKMMTTVYGSSMRWNVRNFMTERLW